MEMQARRTTISLGLLFVVAMLIIAHHPVAHGASEAERLDSVVQQSNAAQAVHGSVMGLLLILGVAMVRFSHALGIGRPVVLTALTAFMISIVMGFIAMTFDGFIIPAIGHACVNASSSCIASATTMFGFSAVAVQMFTRIALFLIAGATLLWSVSMMDRDRGWRIVAGIGVMSACAQVALLFGPAAHLTPHSLIMVLATQCSWFFGLVWLIGFQKTKPAS